MCATSGNAKETGFSGSLACALALGALSCKVFLAVADATLQGYSSSVLGVRASAEPFTAGATVFALALALEVGQGVISSPHESTAFAFALAFAFSFSFLEVVVHVPPELADGLVCETSPRPSGFTILHVNVLGSFCLGHVGNSRVRELLAIIVRGGLRVCAVVGHGNGRESTCTVVILICHR